MNLTTYNLSQSLMCFVRAVYLICFDTQPLCGVQRLTNSRDSRFDYVDHDYLAGQWVWLSADIWVIKKPLSLSQGLWIALVFYLVWSTSTTRRIISPCRRTGTQTTVWILWAHDCFLKWFVHFVFKYNPEGIPYANIWICNSAISDNLYFDVWNCLI